jgi:hypothetical protein
MYIEILPLREAGLINIREDEIKVIYSEDCHLIEKFTHEF